jgi:hypothetical protein
MRVLVIPADTQPCTSATIHAAAWHTELSEPVGGPIHRAAYDWDVVLWVRQDTATQPSANARATRYAFGQSQAAVLHNTSPDRPSYWSHGAVLITGRDHHNGDPPEDVPTRLYRLFGVEHP